MSKGDILMDFIMKVLTTHLKVPSLHRSEVQIVLPWTNKEYLDIISGLAYRTVEHYRLRYQHKWTHNLHIITLHFIGSIGSPNLSRHFVSLDITFPCQIAINWFDIYTFFHAPRGLIYSVKAFSYITNISYYFSPIYQQHLNSQSYSYFFELFNYLT